ncbi:hypothetical protein A3B26_03380 [Candidatus Giovannonibacteria bacterium RIFCSPLOWO2_01_FULL_48_47]|nr:MAG: hypothetical protein A3D61_02090 [Candidatus Giovannonibacteria bacterium RIFCSPHIGHO2_02_FULL_48_15]OGF88624.1 MAG: hypothetical protein A3B26_03380 [Candidatus Giovannonibacteria bacterium RIFCSPLOWO2_01_FULL_48_47]OGF94858.1 MAG: hypothetical protein A2433_02755 [Candidatus Giovannonibacteria bacterium RIFOXYC1_FULL_48_8]OGF95953.1 MAG: hypothetical protein A2613_00020 [Candidatus Giovannonibacteria bacterium RIFOXYD1_FULL_48_21]
MNYPILKRIIFVFVGFLLAVVLINAVMFAAGIKTGFFQRWAEDQYFGKITEIHDGGFTIIDENDREKSILIESDTRVRKGRQFITKEALRVGSYVIVVGSPNDEKQIEARVIRIFADD